MTGENAETVTGTILRIASEPLGDGLTYKMILEEEKDRIFICAYDLSNELALTEPGDKVKLECLPSRDGICTVMVFDNLEFEQR